MRFAWLLLVLAACGAAPEATKTDPIPFRLDDRGVQLLDRDQRIDFGRTDHSVEPAMTKLVGRPPAERVKCIGGGFMVIWPDGTGLIFKAGEFMGWVSATQGTGAGQTCAPSA